MFSSSLYIIIFALYGSCLMHITALHIPVTTNQTDTGGGAEAELERTYGNFSTSITYWDIDDVEDMSNSTKETLKQDVINELINIPANAGECICPRILGPLVCDSTGKLHVNICNFHCKLSTENADLRPTMILTQTSVKISRQLCRQNFELAGDKERFQKNNA